MYVVGCNVELCGFGAVNGGWSGFSKFWEAYLIAVVGLSTHWPIRG
jgi:hypothetical protein